MSVAALPVADDKVCISCNNPVVVSCYNQHFPRVNHRTYTHSTQNTHEYTSFSVITTLCLHPVIHYLSLSESLKKLEKWFKRLERGKQHLFIAAHYNLCSHRQQGAGWCETRLPQSVLFSQRTKRMCQVTLAKALMHSHRNTHTQTQRQMWTSINSMYIYTLTHIAGQTQTLPVCMLDHIQPVNVRQKADSVGECRSVFLLTSHCQNMSHCYIFCLLC